MKEKITSSRLDSFKKSAKMTTLSIGLLTAFSCYADHTQVVDQPGSVLVGYWHNWCDGDGYQRGNAPCIPLTSTNALYNVVNVSFMKVYDTAQGRIPTFELDPNIGLSEQAFINQISQLNAQGRSVLIALGGADAHIELQTGDEQAFADEIIRLVETYGFDGLDIDLEQAAITARDNQTVIPAALRIVKDYYRAQGENFMITMAPEFPYLTGAGAYVPYLQGLEGYYDFINPQFYNQGGDGIYIDSIGWIAQNNDALKEEFIYYISNAIANGTQGFTHIPAERLVFGIPTNNDAAATGYVADPAALYRAFGRMREQGQPLRGIMTWSINWDVGTNSAGQPYNSAFVNDYGPFVQSQSIPGSNGAPTLRGVGDIRVAQGTAFDELSGVSAIDNEDGDLTSHIVLTGSVNTQRIDTYTLTYSVTDSDNNQTTQARVVTVFNNPPELSGVTDTAVQVGNTFNALAGVSASDDEDGDLTNQITINGSVNTATEGQYLLTYEVTDSNGLTTMKQRTVTVTESPVNCATEWDSNAIYTQGDTASYNGDLWRAKWWTQNNTPSTAPNGPWELTGEAGCTTPNPDPSPDPDPTPDPDPIPDPGNGDYGDYTVGANYQAGDRVSHQGQNFECKPFPYSGWCSGAASAYEPINGTHWQDAWTQL